MQSVHHPNPFLFLPSLPHPTPHSHPPCLPLDTRTQLFVNNLPFRVRWQDLKDLFRKAGTVLRADVSLTPENRSKGFGTVLFANRMDARKAVEIYNGFVWQTRILDVRYDQQDPTGALAMAAVLPLQQQRQQQVHQYPQPPLPPHLVAPHPENRLTHPPQNSHSAPPSHPLLRLHASVDDRSHIIVNQSAVDNTFPGDGTGPTILNGAQLTNNNLSRPASTHPQQPLPLVRPASVNAHSSNLITLSTSLPSRRLSSDPELPYPSAHRSIHSYQKHQHSQSLIPFSSNLPDLSSNLSQSAFNASHGYTSHRSSRSVHLFPHCVTPPGSTSTTHSSYPPSIQSLDVHQPEFKPASASVSHSLSQLDISNHPTNSLIPAVVISSAAPNSVSSAHSAPTESLPQSSLRSNSYQASVTDYHNSPSFPQYGIPPAYPHAAMPNTIQRASYSSNRTFSSRLLFVGNLPFSFQWQDLKDLFRQAGNILRADVAITADGRSRGFGTVLFATAEDASKAVEMYEGYELKGRVLKVHFDQIVHPPASEAVVDCTWNGPASLLASNYHPTHYSEQPQHLSASCPVRTVQGAEDHQSSLGDDPANPNHSFKAPFPTSRVNSGQPAIETSDDQRSDLWAPDLKTTASRSSAPVIVPSPLSPIASRRSSYFKSTNPSEYSTANCEARQSQCGNGPEPIGHPATISRPQTIPMPPPYDLKRVSTGMASPAISKVIQMTPSMPAFSFQAFMPATPPLLPQFFSPGIGPPSTPPYGRGGGTPPPPIKSINSPLGASSTFTMKVEHSDSEDAHSTRSVVEHENSEEMKDPAEEQITKKTLDSNVDWGYQSSSNLNSRRASLFIGRTGGIHADGNLLKERHEEQSAGSSTTSTSIGMKTSFRNGFSGRRLLKVGEELVEDRFNENYARRASFDVRSLLNNTNHPNGKVVKTRPKDILISTGSVKNNIDEKLESNGLLDNKNHLQQNSQSSFVVQNQSDRLDLVGLGFVDSIWSKKA